MILLLAANTSQILDYSSYAKDLGVAVTTIKRWISILEASYILFLLPPFYKNFGKRLTKSPKVYFYDTGLVSYLTGIETFKQYNQGPLAGALFENYIIADIYKNILHQAKNEQLYYLRTSNKEEIDLIIDKHQYLEWIEIKKSNTFKRTFIDTIQKFKQKEDKGTVIYQGETVQATPDIQAIAYNTALGVRINPDPT